jgi:probable rRNA maturation factor
VTTTPDGQLALAVHAATGREHVAFLRRHLPAARALLGRRTALRELSVALVGDARMSRLHEEFLSIPGPTDVLTFELDYNRRGRVTAGEVVVCVPEARRQARGVPVRLELLLYALHGMLHLSGFDDRTDRAFRTMHRTEDDILTRLGFGPVFTPGPRPSAGAAAPDRPTRPASPAGHLSPPGRRRPRTRSGAR